ncbi:MAG: hypothetical protein AABW45_02065 [Nanoarchaeota archaeon]
MDEGNMGYGGIVWHSDDIIKCEEHLTGYVEKTINSESFREIFLKDQNLEFILYNARNFGLHFHIVTHTKKTSTCQEKADLINFPLERVIKGLIFEDDLEGNAYVIAVPGTKHKEDIRLKLADILGIDRNEVAKNRIKLARKEILPMGIEYGTVHPILNLESFGDNNGGVKYILFDKKFKDNRRKERGLDDFSLTLPNYFPFSNHLVSMQANYADLFMILHTQYGSERVKAVDLV